MTKIAVIIPVYNAEKHLQKCIESLLKQTFFECEFIFVNDGSQDNSQKIIEDFQKIDNRIFLINQKNLGVSAARNKGIAIAKSTYICFVDADDYVEESFFETLYSNAINNNLDAVVCKYQSSQHNVNFVSKSFATENLVLGKDFIQENIIPALIKSDTFNAIWNKLYKKQIIDKYNIQFPKGVALGEDGWFNLLYFSNAQNVIFIDYAGYHYLDVAGSATRNLNFAQYFKRIEQNYLEDYSAFQNKYLSLDEIEYLKAQKYIHKTIALLHECYNSGLDYSVKNKYITEIFSSKLIREIIFKNYKNLYLHSTKYQRGFLIAFKNKMPIIARLLIAYSNFRNKK